MKAKRFVSIPEWSPLYHEPPHHFRGCTSLNILCRAPVGVIKSLLPEPLKPHGDLFVLRWAHVEDVDGYKNIHFNEINFPCEWENNIGVHMALEYIDNEMGLIIGREVWGYPKKWGDFVWNKTTNGLYVECHRQGVLLMQTEFTGSDDSKEFIPTVEWPDMNYYYLVKHIPPASRSVSALIQVVRLELSELVIHSSTTGSAQVEFFDGPRDPLTHLGPVEVLGATLDSLDLAVDYGEVVATLEI